MTPVRGKLLIKSENKNKDERKQKDDA